MSTLKAALTNPLVVALLIVVALLEVYLITTTAMITNLNTLAVRLVLIVLLPTCTGVVFFVVHYGKLPVQAHKKKEEAA